MNPGFLVLVMMSCSVRATDNVLMTLMGNQCFTTSSSAMASIYDLSDKTWSERRESGDISDSITYSSTMKKIYCEPSNSCYYSGQKWLYKNSLQHNPNIETLVTDRRWEGFKTVFTKHIDEYGETMQYFRVAELYTTQYDYDFVVPFSLQIGHEAHVYMCGEEKVSKSYCYWMMIDAWEGAKSALRQCYAGDIQDKYDGSGPKGMCQQSTSEFGQGHGRLVKEDRWRHFKIRREGPQLTFLNRTNHVLHGKVIHNIGDNIRIFFHSKRVNGVWKIHNFNYYYTTNMGTTDFKLGPAAVGYGCITLFTTMCHGCEIVFKFLSYGYWNREETHQTINIKPNEAGKWQEVKTCFNIRETTLYMRTITQDQQRSDPYWAFNNIEISYGQFPMRFMAPAKSKWTGKCQHLETDNILDKNTKKTDILENWQNCKETEFGEDCTPKEMLHSSSLGSNLGKYCQLFRSNISRSIEAKCYCPIGHEGPECGRVCGGNKYGHGCQRNCTNCQDGCEQDTIFGKCNTGNCFDNFMGEKCDIPYGIFIFANPPEIESKVDSCFLTMKSFEGRGKKEEMTKYFFQYKLKKNSEASWKNFPESFIDFGHQKTVELRSLQSNSMYELRVMGFINKHDLINITQPNYHLSSQIPVYEFETACEVIKLEDLVITPTNQSVRIYLKNKENDPQACKLSEYSVTINGTSSASKEQEGLYCANNLEPYTVYMVTVSKEPRRLLFNTTFRTLESVPSKVRNFSYTEITTSSIFVQWQPPKKPNGQLLYYRILLTIRRFMACAKDTEEFNVTYYEVLPNQTSANLTYLRPYTAYRIRIAANTSIGFGEIEELKQSVNTKQLDHIRESEVPQFEAVIPNATEVTFYFSNANCETKFGYMRTFIKVTGSGCKPSDVIDSVSNKTVVRGLSPYCNYRTLIEFDRNGLKKMLDEVTFRTLEGVPNKVREELVVSKGPRHITLRWLPPHPPTGLLDGYLVTLSSNKKYWNHFNFVRNETLQAEKCTLWPEYQCHTIQNDIKENSIYNIQIRAKNKGNEGYSEAVSLNAMAKETQPSKPLNVTAKWTEENYLNLQWQHPIQANGILLSFDIVIDNIKAPSYVMDSENDYRSTYFTQITKSLPSAKTCNVQVAARNSNGSSEWENLRIESPPPIPKSTIKGISRDANFIEISFEGVVSQESFNSYIYVFASDYGSFNSGLSKAIAQLHTHHNSATQPIPPPLDSEDWKLIHSRLKSDLTTLTISNTSQQACYKIEPSEEYTLAFVWLNQFGVFTRTNYSIELVAAHVPSNFSPALLSVIVVIMLIMLAVALGMGVRSYKVQLQKAIAGFFRRPQQDHAFIPETPKPGRPVDHIYANQNDLVLTELKRKEPRVAAVRPLSVLNPIEICPGVPQFTTVHSKRVKLENFHDYVKEAIRSGELQRQHESFPKGMDKEHAYGSRPENKGKNRYQNMIAYDHSRVVLNKLPGDDYSDYINANFIDGYRFPRAYIATQGPKKNTVADFWRMVWHYRVSHIVMLANVIEGNKKKTEQYWPELSNEEEYGDYKVVHVKSEDHANYECRTLELRYKYSKPRQVTHLHFKVWPDHGVPLYPQTLVPFLQKMLTLRSKDFPLIVHCSAGVGRTGTIILCDITLRMAAYEGHVDLFAMLEHLRNQRTNLVDNVEQYKLAHLVILNCLTGLRTGIKINENFQNSLKELQDIDSQLAYIRQCEWQDEAMKSVAGIGEYPETEKKKNRFSNILPDPVARVYLHPHSSSTSTYINAVYVDGFCHPRKFIATQYPLSNTLGDFWRLVVEQEISVIVCLNQLPISSCKQFWPENLQEFKPVDVVTVKHVRTTNLQYFRALTLAVTSNYQYLQNEARTVDLLNFIGWQYAAPTPDSHAEFTAFVEDAAVYSRNAPKVLVACYDGATASGLFLALSFLLEKIKLEQEVDVCQAVRSIRTSRKQFTNTKEQLEFLYRAAVLYVEDRYLGYANISNKP